jgi:hypothetical protein
MCLAPSLTGPWRSNKTLPYVVAALKRPAGANACRAYPGFGLAGGVRDEALRTAARKLGFEYLDDAAGRRRLRASKRPVPRE